MECGELRPAQLATILQTLLQKTKFEEFRRLLLLEARWVCEQVTDTNGHLIGLHFLRRLQPAPAVSSSPTSSKFVHQISSPLSTDQPPVGHLEPDVPKAIVLDVDKHVGNIASAFTTQLDLADMVNTALALISIQAGGRDGSKVDAPLQVETLNDAMVGA